jgi:hypothetical protein
VLAHVQRLQKQYPGFTDLFMKYLTCRPRYRSDSSDDGDPTQLSDHLILQDVILQDLVSRIRFQLIHMKPKIRECLYIYSFNIAEPARRSFNFIGKLGVIIETTFIFYLLTGVTKILSPFHDGH